MNEAIDAHFRFYEQAHSVRPRCGLHSALYLGKHIGHEEIDEVSSRNILQSFTWTKYR